MKALKTNNSKFYCTENEVVLIFEMDIDDVTKIDEIQVGTTLENEFTIIGFKDLEKALERLGYTILKKRV